VRAPVIFPLLARTDVRTAAELIQTRAQAVEAAVWAAHGRNASAEYKTRIRTLMVNLKDRANPGLRAGVVAGDPDADALATMSTEDMASAERKAENAKIQEQNLFNTLAAAEQEAETDAFTCGRCKQVRRGVCSMAKLGLIARTTNSQSVDIGRRRRAAPTNR
jgi:transcription elongation factor S-II